MFYLGDVVPFVSFNFDDRYMIQQHNRTVVTKLTDYNYHNYLQKNTSHTLVIYVNAILHHRYSGIYSV